MGWKWDALERTTGDDGSSGVHFLVVPSCCPGTDGSSTDRSVLAEEIDAREAAVIKSCSGGSTNDYFCVVLAVQESAVIGLTVG